MTLVAFERPKPAPDPGIVAALEVALARALAGEVTCLALGYHVVDPQEETFVTSINAGMPYMGELGLVEFLAARVRERMLDEARALPAGR